MIRVFINNWWLLALRGVFALVFAILAFSVEPLARSFLMRPIVHAGMVVSFGLLAWAAGMCTIAAAIRGAGRDRSHLLFWDGIAVCIAGTVVLLAPRLDLTWLVHIAAAFALVVGVLELVIARTLRRHIPDEWSLALASAGSVAFGVFFFFGRGNEATSVLRWLGIYVGFSAVTILALAFRLRALGVSVHELAAHAEPPAP